MNTVPEATFLAFDYGEKRIGVAVGNTITRSAKALTILENTSRATRFDAIQKLVENWHPQVLVVGRPCYPDGNVHAMTRQAQRFGRQLGERFNLPVIEVDERYSSVVAEAQLRTKGPGIDAQAACLILQQYFDEGGNNEPAA